MLNKTPASKTKAFTLAEVLITIAIIGVVAALVIPTTISKVNRLQVESGLPVAYRNLQQIITAAEQDEGPMEEWEENSPGNAPNPGKRDVKFEYANAIISKYFAPYVQGSNYKVGNIASYGYVNGIKRPQDLKDGFYGDTKTSKVNYAMMTLSNGMIVIADDGVYRLGFYDENGNRKQNEPGSTKWSTVFMPSPGIRFFVDINGLKKPNVIGKDVFEFQVYINDGSKLSAGHNYVAGTDLKDEEKDHEAYYTKYSTGDYEWTPVKDSAIIEGCMRNGTGCSAWIMRNGWKIPDHYPWL